MSIATLNKKIHKKNGLISEAVFLFSITYFL